MQPARTVVRRTKGLLHPSDAQRFAAGMNEGSRPTGVWGGSLFALLMFLAISAAGFVLWFVSSIVAGLLAGGAGTSDLPEPGLVVGSFSFGAAWLLAWLWLRKKERRPFASLGFRQRSTAARQVVRGILAALALVGVAIFVGVATGDLKFVVGANGGLVNWASLGPVLLAALAFTVQGGAEEIVARGYLLQVWYRRFGIWIAIAVQAAFFVALHAANPGFNAFSAIQLALFATLTAFWALNDGALWGVIALHATWNWALGSVFGTSVSGSGALPDRLFTVVPAENANSWITGGQFGLEGSVTVFVLLFVCTFAAAAVFVKRQRAARGGATNPAIVSLSSGGQAGG